MQAQLQNNFKLLVGEEPQKNWVLWASQFNYWIQGCDPLLATDMSVILIQHFPVILCVTEFQVTRIFEILFPGYTGIPVLVPTNNRKLSW